MCFKRDGCSGSKKTKSKKSPPSLVAPKKSSGFGKPSAKVTFGRRGK